MLFSRYSGLIHCKKCGKNFKSKKERGTMKYICAGYDRYGKEFCTREVIKESLLDDLISLHFRADIETIEVRNYVAKINVYEDNKLEITYYDGSKTVRSRSGLIV